VIIGDARYILMSFFFASMKEGSAFFFTVMVLFDELTIRSLFIEIHPFASSSKMEWIWIVNHHIFLLLWSVLQSFGPIEGDAQGQASQDAAHGTAVLQ
jgi:hypothetical protein